MLRAVIGYATVYCSTPTPPAAQRGSGALSELLPVSQTSGLGVMMGPEVINGTTQFQPGVQARGCALGAGPRRRGCASRAWSMSAAMTAELVTDALVMAIWRRGRPKELLHHSDRGSQAGFSRSSQRPA